MLSITVPVASTTKLEAEVDKINVKAAKKGYPVITLDFGVPYKHGKLMVVDVAYNIPVYMGYGFKIVGSIQMAEQRDELNFVTSLDGSSLDERYQKTDAVCEHCQKKRSRKEMFVVRDNSGVELIIGSTCVHEATGIDVDGLLYSIAAFNRLKNQKFEDGYEEEYEAYRSSSFAYNVESVIILAKRSIDERGYVSGAKARTDRIASTSSVVMDKLCGGCLNATKEEIEFAAFVRGVMAMRTEKTEFDDNMRALSGWEYCDRSKIGFYAYGTLLAVKENEVKKETKDVFFGTVKERYKKVVVTLEGMYRGVSDFGAYVVYTFHTADGVCLSWMTSGVVQKLDTAKNGDAFEIDFTVKDHKFYKGKNNTVITRAKVL